MDSSSQTKGTVKRFQKKLPYDIRTGNYNEVPRCVQKMQQILGFFGLCSTNRCISSQNVWLVGGGTDFPFLLMGFSSSNMLPLRKGISNQRGLKAPLKRFQRISPLDSNSRVFTVQPKYKNKRALQHFSTALTMNTCHQTVTQQCFQLWCKH